jgi:phage terminase large subunit-like protein
LALEYKSAAGALAKLGPEKWEAWLETLDADRLEALKYDWHFWAREKQLPPEGDWRVWLLLAGRGFGKTRAGAEWVNGCIREGTYGRFYLIGATAADIRDIMVEGPSGILQTSPPWFKAQYRPTKRRVEWPNGAVALCFSADEPERFRGEQTEAIWADELAAWRYPEAWTQAMLGLRLGNNPRTVVTTTPRPTKLIIDLVKHPGTYVTRGSTYENIPNLAEAFSDEITRAYEGTRFGRQELYAELLLDVEGALWSHRTLEEHRITKDDFQHIPLKRIVVGVDPATGYGERSGETGIIVAGVGRNDEGYVFGDLSGKYRVDEWARRVIGAYHENLADRVIAEKNQGGLMVEHTIRTYDDNVAVKLVHASRAKETRAEPVAALYEQGKVHHVGVFSDLEEQMTGWEPGLNSPDRMDALVWALTALMVEPRRAKLVNMRKEPDLQGPSYWKM